MRDPEGFRQAAEYIKSATPEQRERWARAQKAQDERRAAADRVLEEADPSGNGLRELLLSNLTTSPHVRTEPLALIWMQCQPGKWRDHHPEECVSVAEMIGFQPEG